MCQIKGICPLYRRSSSHSLTHAHNNVWFGWMVWLWNIIKIKWMKTFPRSFSPCSIGFWILDFDLCHSASTIRITLRTMHSQSSWNASHVCVQEWREGKGKALSARWLDAIEAMALEKNEFLVAMSLYAVRKWLGSSVPYKHNSLRDRRVCMWIGSYTTHTPYTQLLSSIPTTTKSLK